MSIQTIRILIAGVLLVHGLGHLGALAALIYISRWNGDTSGSWRAARSWALPSLSPGAARTLASVFWVLSAVGFVAAALSFWGVLVPGEMWRGLAVAFAFVSGLGILLFLGNWPVFNTLAALAVNVAVLVTQLWTHWPPLEMFGK